MSARPSFTIRHLPSVAPPSAARPSALQRPLQHDAPPQPPPPPPPPTLPAVFVAPLPTPDATVVLVTTLALQHAEEQRREQHIKAATQLAAQQTQQRLKMQLLAQKQRMAAQQQQMKQKQLEQQQQHQAAAASAPSATPLSIGSFPFSIPLPAPESTLRSASDGSAAACSTPQQQQSTGAAVTTADSEANSSRSSSSGAETVSSPHTPPPHSAVPPTDVAPHAGSSTPPRQPATASVPAIMTPALPAKAAATSFLPLPPVPAAFMPPSAPDRSGPPPTLPLPPPPPAPPSDPAQLLAIDRLAEFVHRNAQFEQVIRSKHPPHEPGMFAFLYDETSSEARYYRWKRNELAGAGSEVRAERIDPLTMTAAEDDENEPGNAFNPRRRSRSPSATDPSLAAMEQYVNRLSSTDTAKQRTHVPDAAAHGSSHHQHAHHSADSGDGASEYELPDRFFSRHARHAHTSRAAIAALTKSAQLDDSNVGFQLLSKMGWRGGEGLGRDGRKGRVEPVPVHVGAQTVGGGLGSVEEKKRSAAGQKRRRGPQFVVEDEEESADDEEQREEDGGGSERGGHEGGSGEKRADVYESYKRQMSMRYQHRPNPLNNARRPY